MCTKFQMTNTTESKDRVIEDKTLSHTNLSYLALDPNYKNQH